MKLQHMALGSLSLLLLVGCLSTLKTPSINLRTFVGCAVREFTFLAKKPGCRALRITTDACWGRCHTWEMETDEDKGHIPLGDHLMAIAVERSAKPVLEPPYIEAYHRVCTYNETKTVTVKLPRCAPNVDPFYTYPVAIRCDCDVCSTATTECETA